jgi:predicted porin
VTLYGRIDSGVQWTENSTAAHNNDDLTEVKNGGILPSIWGFKGSEDLGGGLKAVFNLEADFDSSTGGSRAWATSAAPPSAVRPTWACRATGARS